MSTMAAMAARASFCSNCGQPVRGDERFCSNCGHDLRGAGATPAATGVAPPPPAPVAGVMPKSHDGPAMVRVRVRSPLQKAILIAYAAAFTIFLLRFFVPTFGLPSQMPALKVIYQITGPLVVAVTPWAASASRSLGPISAPELAFFVVCLSIFLVAPFVNEVLPWGSAMVSQAELDERAESRRQLNTGLAAVFGVVIVALALYWLSQHPILITGSGPSALPGTPGTGTLTVSADNGYIYIDGDEYGQGGISVTLPAGSYVVSAVSPSTGGTCWQTTISIGNGTQSLIKNGTWCR